MKERDRLRVVLASLTAVLLVCCDAGKEPYKEAVGLDEKGQLREAAEKYDGVCRRNPKSELCPTATSRAGALRLKLALQAVDGGKFADAEKTLKVVAETGDGDAKTKAEAQLASKDLIQGLVYERAVGKTDKRAALKDIEAVAASGTPIAAKAAEWLTKERPPLLLADATAVCVPPTSTCPVASDQLLKLHPGTPEAAKATEYVSAFRAAEEVRIYPLLVQAEKLIEQCKGIWREDRNLQNCHLNALAADPDNPLMAVAACGGSFAGEATRKRRDKLDAAWKQIMTDVADPTRVSALEGRLKKSCDDGEYEKEVPAKPDQAAKSAKSTDRSVGPGLPPADEGFVDTRGGWGWCDKCWLNIKAKKWGFAKAECDEGLKMNPSSPQPRASLLYNEGLIEKGTGNVDEARRLFTESLALREHPEVRAALNSLPGK